MRRDHWIWHRGNLVAQNSNLAQIFPAMQRFVHIPRRKRRNSTDITADLMKGLIGATVQTWALCLPQCFGFCAVFLALYEPLSSQTYDWRESLAFFNTVIFSLNTAFVQYPSPSLLALLRLLLASYISVSDMIVVTFLYPSVVPAFPIIYRSGCMKVKKVYIYVF